MVSKPILKASTEVEPLPSEEGLAVRISRMGEELLGSLSGVLGALSDAPSGPQALAKRLGIDIVLASRVLKAMRSPDPMSVINRSPGPAPLRRVVKAAAKQGVEPAIVRRAGDAIDRFERLIRDEIGDRSSLDAILSAWVPEARQEFELRRKQAAFKATSQLKGAHAEVQLATVFLHPSADREFIDVVWVSALFGLQRLRPGAGVKFATRRLTAATPGRAPRTLTGTSITDAHALMLAEFCSSPLPRLGVHQVGEVVHYTLAGDEFGPRSAVDLVFGEVNLGEIKRYLPPGTTRKGYVFAEVATPAKLLVFDAFVHDEIYPRSEPTLRIYDTACDGVADVNNPARDIDRLDMLEFVHPLPRGFASSRAPAIPRYVELLHGVCERMQWNTDSFRGYRCQIDYPVYGAQVAMLFDPQIRA